MKHLIIGYGYTGYFLARQLIQLTPSVMALARSSQPRYPLSGLNYQSMDCAAAEPIDMHGANVYYLIPPQATGEKDNLLQQFLLQQNSRPRRVYYFGSSGVYGDHQGEWVDEQSPCHLSFDRQKRRMDAEQQWQAYCLHHQVECIRLRISGIYGPMRLPIQAVLNQQPVIRPDMAPMSNHIFIHDLVNIILQLNQIEMESTCLQLADGQPQPMGSLQQQLAIEMGQPLAPEVDFEQVWEQSSPIKREFLSSSKRLSIQRLQSTLKDKLNITPMKTALKESLRQTMEHEK